MKAKIKMDIFLKRVDTWNMRKDVAEEISKYEGQVIEVSDEFICFPNVSYGEDAKVRNFKGFALFDKELDFIVD